MSCEVEKLGAGNCYVWYCLSNRPSGEAKRITPLSGLKKVTPCSPITPPDSPRPPITVHNVAITREHVAFSPIPGCPSISGRKSLREHSGLDLGLTCSCSLLHRSEQDSTLRMEQYMTRSLEQHAAPGATDQLPIEITSETELADDCSTCASTPASVDSDSAMNALFGHSSCYILDRKLSNLRLEFDLESGSFIYTTATGTSGSSSQTSSPTGNGSQNNSTTQSRNATNKRLLMNRRKDDPRDDEGRGKRQKQSNSPSDLTESPARKFACPFFKHNPREYHQRKSCRGPEGRDIHRLKEHLYRKHRLHPCPRCLKTFGKPEEVSAHLREVTSCERRDDPIERPEGIDEEKCKLLKQRAGIQNIDGVTKWKMIYQIIFGVNVNVPSPFYEDADFMEDSDPVPENELRRRWIQDCHKEINRRIDNYIDPILQQYSPSLFENETGERIYVLNKSQIKDLARSMFTQVVSLRQPTGTVEDGDEGESRADALLPLPEPASVGSSTTLPDCSADIIPPWDQEIALDETDVPPFLPVGDPPLEGGLYPSISESSISNPSFLSTLDNNLDANHLDDLQLPAIPGSPIAIQPARICASPQIAPRRNRTETTSAHATNSTNSRLHSARCLYDRLDFSASLDPADLAEEDSFNQFFDPSDHSLITDLRPRELFSGRYGGFD
ncbi:hypothetical protein K469DRAFT_751258 [Zopfia rhizophila CBS 207.26]|uniref:C2H2-type domain-containing protein n=1 Tax=Zopfia rhizophila CBS 207.26 TaxID=1314779 RepID=A0A6A6DYJ4_9PEZI|nr:hypothetical protein K469DRAFT_751258 [Zopfia rhizophila CBS 207.26]